MCKITLLQVQGNLRKDNAPALYDRKSVRETTFALGG